MKTVFIILTGVFLIFYLSMFLTIGKKKSWAYTRWFFVILFVGIFGFFTQWLFFFGGWYFRNKKFNPFWIWMNDSRFSNIRESGYAEDYEIYLNGKKETILTAYWWHIRNKVWNLNNLFKPTNKGITVVEVVYDNLYRNNLERTKINVYGAFAGLKYWKNGVSTHNTNSGDKISIDKSTLGRGMLWYKSGNWLSFRYSECVYKHLLAIRFKWYVIPIIYHWYGWRTIKLGTNSYRFLFTIKYQKHIIWE